MISDGVFLLNEFPYAGRKADFTLFPKVLLNSIETVLYIAFNLAFKGKIIKVYSF